MADMLLLQVQDASPPGRKLRLVTVPFSKHIVFDHHDVHELAALIGAIDKLTGGYATSMPTSITSTTSTTTTRSNDSDTHTDTNTNTNTNTDTDADTSSGSSASVSNSLASTFGSSDTGGSFVVTSTPRERDGTTGGERGGDGGTVVDCAVQDRVIPNLVLKNISDLQACVSSVHDSDARPGAGSSNSDSDSNSSSLAAVRLPKLLAAFASRACR